MSISNPIYNPDGMWQIWNKSDIYTGADGTGQYVPKVGDEVHEISGSVIRRYIVLSLDTNTYLSTLGAATDETSTSDTSPTDVLFAVTPNTYRALIDKSVTPYRLCVDSRMMIHGSSSSYCKVFSGTDISTSGTVISAMYDTAGNYTSENIPLELVASDRWADNTGIKVPELAWTNASLADGDKCTVVSYNDEGVVIDVQTVIVLNTGYIRSTDAYSKAVVSIALETPFLAAANSTIINYPINVPLTALNLIGVVNYSDGSVVRLAVDGTKFSVAGMDAYAPTLAGQTCPITLKYRLQSGEVAYGAENSAQDHFSQDYTIVTTAVEGSYAVQLYCYPIWQDATNGYKLAWFLYDLDRSIRYNVTSLVSIDTTVAAYKPTTYGTKQTLSVYINLQDVNAVYNDFTHVQYVDITLNAVGTKRPASGATPNWYVTQQSGKTPMFGQGVHAKFYQQTSTSYQVDIAGDFSTYATWLNAYYTLSRALYDSTSETSAPNPTHFNLIAGGVSTEYAISQWNDTLTLSQTLSNNSEVYIEFFKRTSSADLHLSKIVVPLWQIDSVGDYV